jgi:serine/threonine protein kinase/Tfp pilus assembly protein PilF
MSNTCPSCLYHNLPSDSECSACGTPLTSYYSANSSPLISHTQLPSPSVGNASPHGKFPSLVTHSTLSKLELQPGIQLQNQTYQILKTIGKGGFGITYEALHRSSQATVAIKELWPENGCRQGSFVLWPASISPINRQQQLHAFQREAAYLQRCQSRNIARVYDCFEENSTVYMVMELVDGLTLDQLQKTSSSLSEPKLINYIEQIAEALDRIHQIGLLHRDIKPQNIMIDRTDRAVLIDFGTAREFMAGQTADMTVYLTHGYAPLEQYSSTAKRFPASDIYALCASTYELLTGQTPSDAPDRGTAIANGEPDPLIPPQSLNPQISNHLARVLMMGLRFRIEERIQTARDLIEALHGNLVSPLHQKARHFLCQGHLEDAIDAYEIAVQREPDYVEQTIELALVLLHLDRREASPSTDGLDRADTLARSFLNTSDGRAHGVCGFVSCHRHQWREAIQQLQQGLQFSPNAAWMWANLAWALGKVGDWRAAEQSIQKALSLSPGDTFALGLKAWIAFQQQQWKVVIQAGSQAIFRAKSIANTAEIALSGFYSWVYPLTIAALENATQELSPDVQRRIDDFVQQCPDSAIAWGWKAQYEYRREHLTHCRHSLESACACASPPVWVIVNRGLIDEHRSDWLNAVQFYEQQHQHSPQNAWIVYRLGTVLGILGQWHSAKMYLDQAIRQNLHLPSVYRNLGWVLSQIRTAEGQVESVSAVMSAYRKALNRSMTEAPDYAQQICQLFQAIGVDLV